MNSPQYSFVGVAGTALVRLRHEARGGRCSSSSCSTPSSDRRWEFQCATGGGLANVSATCTLNVSGDQLPSAHLWMWLALSVSPPPSFLPPSSLLPPLLHRVPSILLRMTLFSDALTMATSMASQVNLRQPGQTECGSHTVVPDPTQPLSIARRPQPRGRTSCGVTSTTLRPGAMLWPEFRAFTSTGEGSCVWSLVPRLGTDLGLKQAGMGRG